MNSDSTDSILLKSRKYDACEIYAFCSTWIFSGTDLSERVIFNGHQRFWVDVRQVPLEWFTVEFPAQLLSFCYVTEWRLTNGCIQTTSSNIMSLCGLTSDLDTAEIWPTDISSTKFVVTSWPIFTWAYATAPQYVSELVRRCDDTRLRSNVRGNFVVSRTWLHVTDKAFSIAGPRAWNALPSDIKLISTRTSFRKRLKTHFLVASSLNFY